MNKTIILCLLSVFLLVSCDFTSKKSELDTIKEAVESVERVVKRYDSNVQSAIDARKFSYITVVTGEALDSVDINLNNLRELQGNPPNKELLETAILYVESLRELILTEKEYSGLTDTLSVEAAKKIDNKFFQSSQKAQQAYSKYSSHLEAPTSE